MINIKRTAEIPPALLKKSFTGVKESLIKMQSGKCYICESNTEVTRPIEHFESKNHKPELEYEWSNLFLACDHCNSIKNYVYDSKVVPLDLLKCDDFSIIISDAIKVNCDVNPKENVTFEVGESFKDNLKVINTTELLNKVFDYQSESVGLDCKALTDKVTRELKKLLDLLHILYFDSPSQEKKDRINADIKDILSKEAPFTAYKIWYLKKYCATDEIEQYLPVF